MTSGEWLEGANRGSWGPRQRAVAPSIVCRVIDAPVLCFLWVTRKITRPGVSSNFVLKQEKLLLARACTTTAELPKQADAPLPALAGAANRASRTRPGREQRAMTSVLWTMRPSF